MVPDRPMLSPEMLAAELTTRPRTIAAFVAAWCPYSADFMRRLPKLDPEKRALLVDVSDRSHPAWEVYGVDILPTAIRFEGDAPAARVDGRRWRGMSGERFRQLFDD